MSYLATVYTFDTDFFNRMATREHWDSGVSRNRRFIHFYKTIRSLEAIFLNSRTALDCGRSLREVTSSFVCHVIGIFLGTAKQTNFLGCWRHTKFYRNFLRKEQKLRSHADINVWLLIEWTIYRRYTHTAGTLSIECQPQNTWVVEYHEIGATYIYTQL